MKDRFQTLSGKYTDDATFLSNCWKELHQQYTGDNRHYHNLQHLEQMFTTYDEIQEHIQEKEVVQFAIFYHDIVYDATKKDNEYQSALYFEQDFKQTHFSKIPMVKTFIEATQKHEKSDHTDLNLLLDIDMSILGQNWKTYEAYIQAVRKEYAIYPDSIYQVGRKNFLEKCLEKPIFHTDIFSTMYEEKARANIRQEINLFS